MASTVVVTTVGSMCERWGCRQTWLPGNPAGDGAPPTIQHVVRSFDPCMVCTVH